MKETTRLIKAIFFVIITFIFAFLLLTGRYPLLSQNNKQDKLITDNSGVSDKVNINNEIKPPLTNNIKKTDEKESPDIINDLNGSWQLIELNSQGKTVKIDLSKKLSPEETMIYKFDSDKIIVYWGNTQSVLTYRWIKKDTIETIQPAASASEKDHKEFAGISIQGGKLYMETVDSENNKSSGIFVRYKGELPKVVSKPKQ